MDRVIFFILSVWAIEATAQQNWANRVGAWSNDAFNAIVIDASGNTYVTGEFGGVIPMMLAPSLVSQGSLDIMVAKYDPTGQPVWVKTFGGTGLDRGIALALGPSGELVVTGQFMATVEFGTQEFTSQAGTQDIFVLKLDGSTGNVIWGRTGGGADGVDQPSDVSISSTGEIAVTGEFRGTAVFNGSSLTSSPDPETGLPSVDIFIAAYSSDGTPLWIQHGAAKYADRGLAIVHDPAGNVYVTGQFSDTITFDVTHQNAMYSAVFLVKFNSLGEEQWFRAFGGGLYNQVFDMVLVGNDKLMLTGDLQGTVIYLDASPDLFTAVAPRSSFLLEVDLNGEFLRQTTWGSEHVVNTRSLSVQGNEVLVFGRFQCQFTGLSAIYGDGTWLATGQHDLYLARFDLDDFEYKDAQQFGGNRNKVPGGVVHAPDGAPIFCGAFDRLLVFPSSYPDLITDIENDYVSSAYAPEGYCSDPNYNYYVGLRGSALMDGFIARGLDETRVPYDIFSREGTGCNRSKRDVRITLGWSGGEEGPDSVVVCGNGGALWVDTRTGYSSGGYHNAPDMLFEWHTGFMGQSVQITETGWYSANVESAAGCWASSDSMHVTVVPIPDIPLISDDVVVNTAALDPVDILVCEPAQPWLWATGFAPSDSVVWSGPSGTVQNDSIQVTATGYHTVTVTNQGGCQRSNQIRVQILPSGTLPDLEAVYEVVFPQDDNLDDTVRICTGTPLWYSAQVELLQDGSPVPLPYAVYMRVGCDNGPWSSVNAQPVDCTESISTEGWYTFDLDVMLTNAPCGQDSLVFLGSGSIYVIPLPVIVPTVSMSGPSLICPGDTAMISMVCTNCDSVTWVGPGIIGYYGDSIHVVGPGAFHVSVYHTDVNGCSTMRYATHLVEWNPDPLLLVLPTDGIICPDSAALIFTDTQGSDYQWYGPLGPLNVDNDTIQTSQQGLYYLEMIDYLGCFVTSPPILITDYATPFLNVLPDNILCEPGDVTTLQVITTSASTVQWQTPLSESALQQVVSQPGVYTCTVNGCGVTTELSVEIYGNEALAELTDPGPFLLCGDDSLLLVAGAGMSLYYWLPGPIVDQTLLVSEAGTYTLVVADNNGCQASTEVVVAVIPWTQTLETNDTTVCLGSPLVLSVPGSGIITWYADQALTQVIAVGNVLDLGIPTTSGSVHVQQIEGDCSSIVHSVEITVVPVPISPVLSGEDTLCVGAPFDLALTGGGAGLSGIWSTPVGPFTGSSFMSPSVTTEHAGTYTAMSIIGPCRGDTVQFELVVMAPSILDLGSDTTFCEGGEFVLTVPAGFTNQLWTTGSTATSIVLDAGGAYGLSAVDGNGCTVSDMITLTMVHCDTFIPNVITPNGDGVNDAWILERGPFKTALLTVFDRYGGKVWEGDPSVRGFRGDHFRSLQQLTEGTYFYVLIMEKADGGLDERRGYLTLIR